MPAITRGSKPRTARLLRPLQHRARLPRHPPHQLPLWRLQLHPHLQGRLHLSLQRKPGSSALHRPHFRGCTDPTVCTQRGLLRCKGTSLHTHRWSASIQQRACLHQSQRQGPVKVAYHPISLVTYCMQLTLTGSTGYLSHVHTLRLKCTDSVYATQLCICFCK